MVSKAHEQLYERLGYNGPDLPRTPTRGVEPMGLEIEPGPAEAMAPEPLPIEPGYALDERGVVELERAMRNDPSGLLTRARAVIDPELSEADLQQIVAEAKRAITRPEDYVELLQARRELESATSELPPGFSFPGYPANENSAQFPEKDIPTLNPGSTKFETIADAAAWALFCGAAMLKTAFTGKADFVWHDAPGVSSQFRYPMVNAQDGSTRFALFADFGTGLAHSWYVARQIATLDTTPEYAVHLGDVYYAGTAKEFEKQFKPPILPIQAKSRLFTLNSNHEMLSGGKHYFEWLKFKKQQPSAVLQEQEGSYFCLHSEKYQVVGIDTDYHDTFRYPDPKLRTWLGDRLREGKRAGKINVLLSPDEPYTLGKKNLTKLFSEDLYAIVQNRLVDLWIWGNTHYCALYAPGHNMPFVGSCIGHGGYPYSKKSRPSDDECAAPVEWVETESRYFPHSVRQDRGNNGFCVMSLAPEGIHLVYVDWRRNVRHRTFLRADWPAVALKGTFEPSDLRL